MSAHLKTIRGATSLPIAVGFGIKTEQDAQAVGKVADAAVVGSALVAEISRFVGANGKTSPGAAEAVLSLARRLAEAAHSARH
jgi:tryptophan synthase alpha chain